jgi:crossover junction endodeoxyribonuclease RuvC
MADADGGPRHPSRAPRRTNREVIILGIDPGTLVTGYGVVARSASGMRLLGCGTIKNDSRRSMPLRLRAIYTELCAVITAFHPDECAVESAFYGKNAQSALKLGHARGVSILAAVLHEIPTSEYSPREVKRAVVGNGAASKEQVQFMVKSLLHATQSKMLLDTSDAIATAVCHLHRLGVPAQSYKDWKSFVRDHPDRVRP